MIYVFGMGGGSTALADEMRFRLVRLGRPVASYQDGLLQRMVAATLSREHVVVRVIGDRADAGNGGELPDRAGSMARA